MPTTVKDFFDRRVPAALAANAGRAKEVAAVCLFKISGPDGGTWTVDLTASPPVCTAGATGQPGCTIEVSDQDLCALVDGGTQAAMQILMAGRLKVGGNPALIAKLMGMLQTGGS
jgi:alkyl sulfatase BDS1-like metallo-beta-lactamase superfamily hydrolase